VSHRVTLRRARAEDVGFITALENRPEFADFINSWPADRHLRAMADPDFRHLIFELDRAPLGYAILSGLASPNASIQLLRIAIARTGEGLGRTCCELVLEETFDRLGAHRLHLDLFEGNHRAERLYARLGFQSEGLLRDAERRNGAYRSLKIMSLLEHEFRALRPQKI
jgi:RimJ/RimL family protein N-acetyltransferase